MTDQEAPKLRPQAGPQERLLASRASIAIFGGAAGSGKTWTLLADAVRHISQPLYNAVIFRRTYPQITQGGGLWDEATGLYGALGGSPSDMDWVFPSGAKIQMRHLQHEKNRLDHQGGQYDRIGFDELTHFSARQFWYLVSRARSRSGLDPRIRSTCNPDPDSFVAGLIGWWIGEDGYPIRERSGKLRWFLRAAGDTLVWGDSRQELVEAYPDLIEQGGVPQSLTFVAATIDDNPAMDRVDPGYRGRLTALNDVERKQLLLGNWKVRPAGTVFGDDELRVWEGDLPPVSIGIYVDAAYSDNSSSDWTACVVLGVDARNNVYVLNSWRRRLLPEALIDAIFEEVARWEHKGVRAAHLEANASTFTAIRQEMRLRSKFFELVELKHRGRAKADRIRQIRAHLPRLHLRRRGDELLRGDLIAYRPDDGAEDVGASRAPDDLPDALAHGLEHCQYSSQTAVNHDPRPSDPLGAEIWDAMHAHQSPRGGRSTA